ncbi:hypothetical protein [Streptomyces gobitricini]|uniref:Uncharacterized protein n=1 Tax=Streptomyces gobitricini TaxID=68211 RepID=A0ABN3MEA2_9ACTN
MRWYPRVSIDTATGVVKGVGSSPAYEQLRARPTSVSPRGASPVGPSWRMTSRGVTGSA